MLVQPQRNRWDDSDGKREVRIRDFDRMCEDVLLCLSENPVAHLMRAAELNQDLKKQVAGLQEEREAQMAKLSELAGAVLQNAAEHHNIEWSGNVYLLTSEETLTRARVNIMIRPYEPWVAGQHCSAP